MPGTIRLARKVSPKSSKRSKASVSEHELKNLLLAAITGSSTIGFAVCDERLRLQLVNEAWAMMHGANHEAHLGETMRKVLGPRPTHSSWPSRGSFQLASPF